MKKLLSTLEKKQERLYLGGGISKLEKHKESGKLTAWERVFTLLDNHNDYVQIGSFAADDIYIEEENFINAGVIVVLGYIDNKLCIIVSTDATVNNGTWLPITCKKIIRAQEIALENHIPIIYLIDTSSVSISMQSELFADKEHFGKILRNSAKINALGITQISAIMGSCIAGTAFLPIMSNYTFIVENTGAIYLADSYRVKSSIGESIDNEKLGGANTHAEISGITDNKYPNDESCLNAIKNILDKFGDKQKAGYSRIKSKQPKLNPASIYTHLPEDRATPYDMHLILEAIIDKESMEEYKKDYGKTIICTLARIDGWAVGIIANQHKIVKSQKPNNKQEVQIGGVIYPDAADKAARFIMNCNEQKIPLVFFQDVTGFMLGSKAEHEGILKDGAKMINAMANSIVPKFTFIIGNSFGTGNYAMCGRAFDPRLIYAWPTAQIAVMSQKNTTTILLQLAENKLKSSNTKITTDIKETLIKDFENNYFIESNPYYAASKLWIDGVIDPKETRKIISMGIEAANYNSDLRRYNVGVIQT